MIYARSDVQCITVPKTSGGCGESHRRPYKDGRPAKVWGLDCPECESHLKGDGKPKILKYNIDKNTGQAVRQERVPDSSDLWGATPDTIPLTPDEERTNTTRTERGRMQIEMLQALAAIRSSGINVPAEALYLLERELPEGVLRGTVVCANGHDAAAGSRFCPECGISMNARGALEAPGESGEPASVDLGLLHVQSLRKMCRERDLPDKGSKDDLIGRLQAAA